MPLLRYPITGRPGRCARAASGQAAAAPPRSVMKSRRCILCPQGEARMTETYHIAPGPGVS